MFVNFFINLFFTFAAFLITLLPTPPVQVTVYFFDIVGKGLYVFGPTTFAVVIANVVFWSSIHLGWAIIEWIYKKIPGVS